MASFSLGTVPAGLKRWELEECVVRWQATDFLLWPVTASLHDDDRAILPTECTHILQPVRQRIVAEQQALSRLFAGGFEIRLPDAQKDRAGLHKQRVCSVIDILPTKVPDVQHPSARRTGSRLCGDGNAVCGSHVLVIRKIA